MSVTTPIIVSLVDENTALKPMVIGLSDIMEYMRTLYDIDVSTEEFPNNIMELMNDNYNKHGLKKWFNFYQPLVGTDTFINFILNTIKVRSTIIPWYETMNPTNTFDLIMDQYPEFLDKSKFVSTINFYKNIESKLASVKLIDCPLRFTLDYSMLDMDILSDTYGVDIDGVTFCFRIIHKHSYTYVSNISTLNVTNTSIKQFSVSEVIAHTGVTKENNKSINLNDFSSSWKNANDWNLIDEWDMPSLPLVYGYLMSGESFDVTGRSITVSGSNVNVMGGSNVNVTGRSITSSNSSVTVTGGSNVTVTGTNITSSGSNVNVMGGSNVTVTGTNITASGSNVIATGASNVNVTGRSITVSGSNVIATGASNVTVTGTNITSSGSNVTIITENTWFTHDDWTQGTWV